MRLCVVLTAALVAASTAALPSIARAESDYGFGVVPGFRFGPNFGPVPNPAFVPAGVAAPEAKGGRGWLAEAHLDALFAGRRFGAGASLGYVVQGIASPYEPDRGGIGFNGVTLTPMLMFAPVSRVFLVGKAGLVFGGIDYGAGDSVSTTGWRAGGQLQFVVYRNAGADLTLGLDFIHTEGRATDPSGKRDYSANAIVLDTTFSFFAEMLDL